MNKDQNIITLEFGNQNIPLPIESKNTSDGTFVTWGLGNLYPVYLIDLYNQSAIHSAIVNQKTNYIIGGGLKTKESEELNLMVNPSDSLKEFTAKVVKDYLLFNSFAVEVIFNVFGQPVEYHHIPVHKIRMNKTKTKFWYCEDWLLSRKYITYDRYNTKKNTDSTSKIFYFDGYFPSINNVYPTPEYIGSLKAISTDCAIREFNLNNIKNHFSPSTIITFFNGSNVSEPVKKQIIDEIDTKFRGESGKKFIIDFQTKEGKSAEIKQLSANDWDKAYIEINNKNTEDIIIGHECQNPSLFGIKTAGQLGSSQELEVSYEMFKNNYISVKRSEIEIALNQLFKNFDSLKSSIEFIDKPLFNTSLSDALKEKVYTINELRKLVGLEALPDGDRLISEPKPSTVEPVVQEEVKKNSSGLDLTEDDYEKIKHLGSSFEDFDIVEEVEHSHQKFDTAADISQFVLGNDIKGVTVSELVDILGEEGKIYTNINTVQSILQDMTDANLINVEVDDNGRIKILPLPKPEIPSTGDISVMYKYVLRPNIEGPDLIPTSRSFCVKLIDNNRLYTREDIQEMASIFGYDIFKFGGGWYHNPETNTTTSHCRHMWKALKVKKRN